MKVLLLSDIHATRHTPSSCTDTYMDDLLDLLRQTQQIALWERCEAVVWAGDVFHHKAPSRTSHQLVLEMVRIVQGYHCPVFIVPGNHDIQNDRLDSVHLTQPLGTLLKAGAIELIGWGGYDAEKMYPFYGVPWLQHWTDEAVSQALAGYRDSFPRPGLVVTHAPLYPPGRELPYENYPAAAWDAAMGEEGGHVFYGHVHEPHGTWSCGHTTFCNNGALSRGSLHEYNLDRTPMVTIWDSETGKFETKALDARPAAQVFRLAEKTQATDIQGRLDEFLSQVGATSLQVVSIEAVIAHMREKNVRPEVQTLVEQLLEEVRT